MSRPPPPPPAKPLAERPPAERGSGCALIGILRRARWLVAENISTGLVESASRAWLGVRFGLGLVLVLVLGLGFGLFLGVVGLGLGPRLLVALGFGVWGLGLGLGLDWLGLELGLRAWASGLAPALG